MPDPKSLKVDDLVRFVTLPDEWSRPGYSVPKESVAFMKLMIGRSWPSRVSFIDEYGQPWISARVFEEGVCQHHTWAIMESTGWRLVKRRSRGCR